MNDVSDPRRKIASKIAKLLRRAERGDGPEAETARELAERLMSRHGIEVDLDELDEVPAQKRDERVVLFTRDRKTDMWAQFLIQEVSPLYGCTHRHLEVDAGWTYCIEGPPAQVELCAIHVEYLISMARAIAGNVLESMKGWIVNTPSVRDGVHWGTMDGLFERLRQKIMAKGPGPEMGPEAPSTVTKLNLLALSPAPHLSMRGDEVAVFEGSAERPEEISAEKPPYWAWERGYAAASTDASDPEPPDIVYQPVESLALPSHLCAQIREAGIVIVAQLVRMPPSALLHAGIDWRDLDAIRSVIVRHGLYLAREQENA